MASTASRTRRQRERDRHRAEILGAARRVFCDRGFERATMSDIAEEAEFAVGTLYRFFSSKEALFEALILEVARKWAGIVNTVLDEAGTEVERLERFIEKTTEYFFADHTFAKLLMGQSSRRYYSVQGSLSGEAWEVFTSVEDRLTDLFEAGIRKKLFIDVRPRFLTIGLQGVTNALLDEYMHDPKSFEGEDAALLRKRIFLDAVCLKRGV